MTEVGARVGVLGTPSTGEVDRAGTLDAGGFGLRFLVGAEDRWHDPERDAGVRHERAVPAPAYVTKVRVPSGDAVQRVYAARSANGGAYVVVEVENASPAPFALTFVLTARARRAPSLSLDGNVVRAGGRAALILPKPPMRWASGAGAADVVVRGEAGEGPFVPAPGGRREAAVVFPVAHRTQFRVAVALDDAPGPPPDLLEQLPNMASVQRGWVTQLDRAMRIEVPGPLQDDVDAARATLLLDAGARRPDARTIVDLEDWGFDDETATAWHRARTKERRAAAHRRETRPTLLSEVRAMLLDDRGDELLLLPGFPDDWAGQPVTVHDAPTRAGRVSYAVRWHGERPALLWDAPRGVTVRAPALDREWSVAGGEGETLLASFAPSGARLHANSSTEP
jgi:hypothetical protein